MYPPGRVLVCIERLGKSLLYLLDGLKWCWLALPGYRQGHEIRQTRMYDVIKNNKQKQIIDSSDNKHAPMKIGKYTLQLKSNSGKYKMKNDNTETNTDSRQKMG